MAVDFTERSDIAAYNIVLIWCEGFSEFMTVAEYR